MSSSAARHTGHHVAGDSLTRYLDEIRRYPLLDRAAEIPLARRIREGDAEALHLLICSNLRFVVSIAKKYQHQGVPLGDLINEGNIGLMRAAERFDESKGVRFISYAVWWVRQAIVQALAEHAHAVRLPVNRAALLYRINRSARTLRQAFGREPTQRELATEMNVSEDEIAAGLPIARAALSLDAPTRAAADGNLLDVFPDTDSAAPDAGIAEHGLADSVENALAHLRAREARVLRLYFGFEGNEPMTLEAIGALLGVTRERVRQIKERGLSRLRKGTESEHLASFCGHERLANHA